MDEYATITIEIKCMREWIEGDSERINTVYKKFLEVINEACGNFNKCSCIMSARAKGDVIE